MRDTKKSATIPGDDRADNSDQPAVGADRSQDSYVDISSSRCPVLFVLIRVAHWLALVGSGLVCLACLLVFREAVGVQLGDMAISSGDPEGFDYEGATGGVVRSLILLMSPAFIYAAAVCVSFARRRARHFVIATALFVALLAAVNVFIASTIDWADKDMNEFAVRLILAEAAVLGVLSLTYRCGRERSG